MKRFIRIALTVIAVIFLIWFLVPIVHRVFNIGNVVGILICCAVIFRFGFVKKYKRFKAVLSRKLPARILLRVNQIGASAFCIYALLISCVMVYAMCVTPAKGDTAVVLGAQVMSWGPSPLLRQRIDAAELYLNNDQSAKAVVTGGKGDNEPMSEGQCIYDCLTANGISPDRLYIEDRAENTEQNIRYSLQIIKENDLNRDITVVTDSYHQLRARIIASKADSSVKVSAVNTKQNYIGLSAYPTYFVREWIAIPAEILK